MLYLFLYLQETASSIEHIIKEFKGPAGLDIDGIPLFKSEEAVDTHWSIASKHLGCMQVKHFNSLADNFVDIFILKECSTNKLAGEQKTIY